MNNRILQKPRRVLTQPISMMDMRSLGNYLTEFTTDETQASRNIWKQFASRKGLVDGYSGIEIRDLVYYQTAKTGQRKIPYKYIKTDTIRFANNVRKEQRKIAQSLVGGSISGQDWYEQTLYLTKISHWAAFIVAEGASEELRDQEHMDTWLVTVVPIFISVNKVAENLNAGLLPLDGRVLLRADTFADNIVQSFENFRLNWALGHGVRYGRRVLDESEHCVSTGDRLGCVELALRGWQNIYLVVPIGGAACWHKCHCTIEYRNGEK